MNLKSTYVLFGILAAMLIVFGVALYVGPKKSEASQYVLQEMHDDVNPFPPGDVNRVVIKRRSPEETWVFERDKDQRGWTITSPRKLRADAAEVTALIDALYSATPAEAADKPKSLKDWGLDPADVTITLAKGDEREVKLDIGDASGTGANDVIYVKAQGSEEPVAVAYTSLSRAKKKLNEFRDRYLLASSSSDIKAVSLSESKDHPKGISLKEVAPSNWEFTEPNFGSATFTSPSGFDPNKAPQGVNSLLTDLSNVRVADPEGNEDGFVKEDARDLSEYHLDPDKDNVLRLEIARVEQVDEDDKPTTKKVALLVGISKKAPEGDYYYAVREGSKDVVLVETKAVEPMRLLLQSPDTLRDKDLLRLTAGQEPDAVNIQNSTGLLEFRREGPIAPWMLYRDDKSYEVDKPALTKLFDALKSKGLITKFLDAKDRAKFGLDKPSAELALWVDGVAKKSEEDKKEEDKKDTKKEKPTKPSLKEPNKPLIRLRFGARQGEDVVVERLREDAKKGDLVQVPATLLELVSRGPLAYLDKSVPSFPLTQVTSVVLQRPDKSMREINKKNGTWTITKPSSLDGRKADEESLTAILRGLNNLAPDRLAAEKPTESDLERFGLKSPQARAVITTKEDDKKVSYEYTFGKDDGKGNLYAMSSKRPVVYVVRQGILDTLKQDLRDLTVFDFDVSKVDKVEIQGWAQVIGIPTTIKAVREGSDWTATLGTNKFQLNPTRLEKLLRDLAHLRATRFVSETPEPDAKYGLEVKEGALVITVTLKDKKEHTLTIGKPVGDNGFYATSDQTRKAILEVSKAPFADIRDKPSALRP